MLSTRTNVFLNEPIERRLGFARAVCIGDLLFISGTVSVDQSGQVVGSGDMAVQLETIYSNLQIVLGRFGATLADVAKETIFVTDMDSFLRVASVRAGHYRDTNVPAVTGVEVRKLAHPDLLVEIEAIAALPRTAERVVE